MKNLLVGQSGGPTAVINASLYGVVKAALASPEIDHVYGMVNGIEAVSYTHLDVYKRQGSGAGTSQPASGSRLSGISCLPGWPV